MIFQKWATTFVLTIVSLASILHIEALSQKQTDLLHIRTFAPTKVFCRYRELEYHFGLDFRGKMEEIRANIYTLTTICDKQLDARLCRQTTQNMQSYFRKLHEKVNIMESIRVGAAGKTRSKRSANEFFDEFYDLEWNTINKTVKLAESGYNELRDNIVELRKYLACFLKVQESTSVMLGYMSLNSISGLLSSALSNLHILADNIIDIITQKDRTKLMDLISLNQIIIGLKNISARASNEGCDIPGNIVSAYEIYEILKRSPILTRIENTTLIINIRIPTTYIHPYIFYEAIPIPFSVHEDTYIVDPVHRFALVYEDTINDSISVITLSTRERSQCEIIAGKCVCYPEQGITTYQRFQLFYIDFIFVPDYEMCRALTHTSCNIKKYPHKNSIIRLYPNVVYIYVTKPGKYIMTCNGNTVQCPIEKPRVIFEKEGCYASIENMEWKDKTVISASGPYIISNDTQTFNFSEIELTNRLKDDLTTNLTREFSNLRPDFEIIEEMLKEYKKELINKSSSWTTLEEVLTIAIIFLSLVIIASWAYLGYYLYIGKDPFNRDLSMYCSMRPGLMGTRVPFRSISAQLRDLHLSNQLHRTSTSELAQYKEFTPFQRPNTPVFPILENTFPTRETMSVRLSAEGIAYHRSFSQPLPTDLSSSCASLPPPMPRIPTPKPYLV